MQVIIKQSVWISLPNLPAFLADPQGRSEDLVLSHSDYPLYMNAIKLGEFEILVQFADSKQFLRQQAVNAIDKALSAELASHHKRTMELGEIKQSLLAISYEG